MKIPALAEFAPAAGKGASSENQPSIASPSGAPPVRRIERKRGRKTVQERLQEIIQQQQLIDNQRRELEALQRKEERARNAQIEGIIGAAVRAEASCHDVVRAVLEKHVKDARSRALLRADGWLS